MCQLWSLGWGQTEYNIWDTHTKHLSKWAPRTPGLLFSKPPLLNSNHKMRLPPRFPSQLAVLLYQSSLLKSERSGSEVQGVYFQTGIMIRVILPELWLGMCLHKGARCQKKATQTAAGPEERVSETGQNGKPFLLRAQDHFCLGWMLQDLHAFFFLPSGDFSAGDWCSSTWQPCLCSSSQKNKCSRPLHIRDSSLCFSPTGWRQQGCTGGFLPFAYCSFILTFN